MKKMFIYLAHPYRHESYATENDRITQATLAAGSLIRYGIRSGVEINVLAPVLHNSKIYRDNNFTPQEMWHVFETFDHFMLKKADIMVVLTLEGWKESTGVQAEIKFCQEHNIPIAYLDYANINKSDILKEIADAAT